MRNVHFIGIGGVGMNGLAQLAVRAGYRVTGSDRAYDPNDRLFNCLQSLGIVIHAQDGCGIGPETDVAVFSTAIEPDNPDVAACGNQGIPLLHRAEFLKELVGDNELIAVAGTAGKTTTTGMLGWIFECLDLDPTVYNGAAVLNWKTADCLGNVRRGTGPWIIEADESDRSFLNFHPNHSVITNISEDHFDLTELNAMFDQFEAQTSGISIRGPIRESIDMPLQPIGRHNLENARCAAAFCRSLGLDESAVIKAIGTFKGIERRLEIVGTASGITIIDDYSHNPAKIAAALSAVQETVGTTHAYWRPHGYGPLAQHMEALAEVFAHHSSENGGSIHILPVYYAGGTVKRTARAEDLVDRIKAQGARVQYVPDYDVLKKCLEENAEAGDAVLGMGARDPELPRFAKRLVNEWKTNE